ncbi:MAG: hypothetical protein IJW48_03515 [Clostridia bacterium]|nr:hypothetical protein [Clostridia bacterium]
MSDLSIWDFDGKRRYTHTLRPKSELFDLRVGYANLTPWRCHGTRSSQSR